MSEIIIIKKISKNGQISESYHKLIVKAFLQGKIIVIPIDGVYVIATIYSKKNYKLLKKLPIFTDDVVLSVSNFTMLEKYVRISKQDHDFLHRIWPGHVTVILESNNNNYYYDTMVNTIMPNSHYIKNIIEEINQPVIYMNILKTNGKAHNTKSELHQAFSDYVDLLVIIDQNNHDSNNLNHNTKLNNTKIDIRNNELKILQEGKVFSEEITSLYFLGADDIYM
jgi:tRNA A37 threonylcarbamoyladenosine synthetase subunit TsaC/SUA5/YrdC